MLNVQHTVLSKLVATEIKFLLIYFFDLIATGKESNQATMGNRGRAPRDSGQCHLGRPLMMINSLK